jgi:hypothetical protein
MEPPTSGPESERPPDAPDTTGAPRRRLARRWRGGGPGIGAPVYRKRRIWPEAILFSVLSTAYLVVNFSPWSDTPVHPSGMGWMKWGVWGIVAFFALWTASTPYGPDSATGRRLKGAAMLFGVAPIIARLAGWI